jgi:hypothetical protein
LDWQAGFLLLFSVHFDGEKPDKITRGACNVSAAPIGIPRKLEKRKNAANLCVFSL